MTSGGADLQRSPRKEPYAAVACGIGYPCQLGPHTAGLFVNMRGGGVMIQDFEVGVDFLPFEDAQALDPQRQQTLTRNETSVHPQDGRPMINLKQTGATGFVPVGALARAEGPPHRHAGTGFGLYTVMQYPADGSAYDYTQVPDQHSFLQLQQYRWDGGPLEVTHDAYMERHELLDGWLLEGASVTTALPDDEDLLLAMSAWRSGPRHVYADGHQTIWAGLARWRRLPDLGWRPISFVPVVQQCAEPSLIRVAHGRLLMCVRRFVGDQHRLEVFASDDGGGLWFKAMDCGRMRSPGPVGIARTVGGGALLIGNPYHSLPTRTSYREAIAIWPLTPDHHGIADNLRVMDANDRFGPAPNFSPWNVDHPIGYVVRLGDDRLHSLIAIRVCETSEVHGTTLPTPHTGTYLEEITAEPDGPPLDIWHFRRTNHF